jgi:hypothetical protein
MEQVTVPQFLDVEDKIIGPITVRQFIEMLVAGIIIFIFYKIFDFSLFIVSGLFVSAIAVIFAFVKINGQPFHIFVLNFILTLKNPKLKVWKKVVDDDLLKASLKKPAEENVPVVQTKRRTITSSSLSELSLIVDTGGVYQGEGVINSSSGIKQKKT